MGRGYIKKNYIYPKKRDVVFILGAGASYANGAPIQSEIVPIILSDKFDKIKNSKIGQQFTKFLIDNFFFDKNLRLYPTLEEIFAFLDFFINQNRNLNNKYDLSMIKATKENLIKLIHFIFSYYTNFPFTDSNKDSIYRKFWEYIKNYNRNISIITLNYDTLLEEAFAFLYPDYSAIDYCIKLINYDYESGLIDPFNWWDNPREELIVWGDSNPIPIKILKIHGSINWKYCSTCKKILLTPWQTNIDLNIGSFYEPIFEINNPLIYCCPYDKNNFESLIIQPSYIKELSNPIIYTIYKEALNEIKKSKKIVFIGYSFPEADIHIKALLKQGLINNKKIIVMDIDNSEKFKYRFVSLSSKVEFFNLPFEELLENNKLMEYILIKS